MKNNFDHIVLAGIFPLEAAKEPQWREKAKVLQINGHDIAFLKEPLLKGCQFCALPSEAPYSQVWVLEFFKDSPFRVTLGVSLLDLNETYLQQNTAWDNEEFGKKLKALKAQVERYFTLPSKVQRSQHVLLSTKTPPCEADFRFVSQWLRASNSLKQEHFEVRARRFFAVDARGMGLIVQAQNQPSLPVLFDRLLILFALSQAYLMAINKATTLLAESCEHPSQLRTLYQDTLVFNARYFFRYPVKLNNVELPKVWEQIHARFALSDFNDELISQANAVKSLLDEELERQETARANRLNIVLSLLGVGIGILSLLTLVEITPEVIHDFFEQWGAWLRGS